MAITREFTANMKFYDSPTHGSVLEVELAGPASQDGSKRLSNTFNECIAGHQPQCLVINLREFELPFHDHLLGAFIGGYAAMMKLGPGRKFALVAAGETLIELEEFLRVTKLESVLGPAYPDVETALAEARVTAEPSPPKPRKTQDLPLHPGVRFPDLEPQSTLILTEFVFLLLGSWLVATVLGWLWKPMRWLILIPGFLFLLSVMFTGFRVVRNCVRRVRWAWSFSGRVTARKATKMLKEDPSRYIVHSQQYGGFDSTKLIPATLIEDTHTATLVAVFPPSRYL